MSGNRHVITAVAALAVIAVSSCSSSTSSVSSVSSGTTPAASPASASPRVTSSVVAKAKQEATACVQKTGTGALLSSQGRTEVVNCLKGLVPTDKLPAFKTCVTTAAKNDKLWTSEGRTKFTQTSVPNCVNQATA
jgi:hypothetical protein